VQTTSDIYKEIKRSSAYRKEIKLNIAGAEIAEAAIVSISTTGGLFTSPRIGGCQAREIDLQIFPGNTVIPRMAEIRLFVRLVSDAQETEWLSKGVFYIDTRDADKTTGLLTIHGYDAMLKAEQIYLSEVDAGEWPRSERVVVAEIAQRMGVELDSRTVLTGATIPYPNDYTMREILGYIAVAHGGNWIITDAGKLRLVPLWSFPAETSTLVTEHGDAILFGEVKIRV
jgi:hypothetical protein